MPLHGDGHQIVAPLLHQPGKPLALVSDDQGESAGHVLLVHARPRHVGPGDPKSRGLQLLQGGGDVHHPGDQHVFAGPGARFHGGSGDGRAPMLTQDDPVSPGAVGAADDGTQVVGVLHPVQHHHKGLLPLLVGQGQDVADLAVFHACGVGHDPLVVGGLAAVAEGQAHLVQLLAVHLVNDDPGVLSQGHDLPQ